MKAIRPFELNLGDRTVVDPVDGCVASIVAAGVNRLGVPTVWAVVDADSPRRRPWVVYQVESGRPLPARAHHVDTFVSRGRDVHVLARRGRYRTLQALLLETA